MRKPIVITAVCTFLATLLLVWLGFFISGRIEEAVDWKTTLRTPFPCSGRIVFISHREVWGGYLVYLENPNDLTEELVEVWVYDETMLFGEYQGMTMEEVLENRITGAYVDTMIFEHNDAPLPLHWVRPAMSIEIVEAPE